MTFSTHSRIKSFAFANAKLANPNVTMEMIDRHYPEACVKASSLLQYLSGRQSVSENKPVAGQWYELDGKRLHCIGLKTNGRAYMEHDNENFEVLTERRQRYLKHLPDCTGWDWVPETFPQYWTSYSGAFLRRDSQSQTVTVGKDGSEVVWSGQFIREAGRKQITEAEALALLDKPQQAQLPEAMQISLGSGRVAITTFDDDKGHGLIFRDSGADHQIGEYTGELQCVHYPQPGEIYIHCSNRESAVVLLEQMQIVLEAFNKPQPAEDPEEWVVLDPSQYADHMPRDGVDEFFNGRSWEAHDWKHCRTTVGEFAMVSDESRVRCRRKDLPKPKPRRTVTVPKWLVIDDQGLTFILEQSEAPSGSSYIKVSKVGETTYEIEE